MTAESAAAPRMVAVRFLVEAEAGPGLLPRLLQPFAKRDLTPDRMWSQRHDDTLQVGLNLHAVDDGVVHLIEGNLRQVVGVISVTRMQADNLRAVA
jgi:hypothetical protein